MEDIEPLPHPDKEDTILVGWLKHKLNESEHKKRHLFYICVMLVGFVFVLSLVIFALIDKPVNVQFSPELIRYSSSDGQYTHKNIQAAHVNWDVKPYVDLADDLGYDWGELFGNSMQPTFFEGNLVLLKRYTGETLKTGQIVRFYRLNESENCDSIAEKEERDTKTVYLKINDLSISYLNGKPYSYTLTYTKNMSSCVMLYRYDGNDFFLTANNQFCNDGEKVSVTIQNTHEVLDGGKYRLCRPSGGVCSDLFTSHKEYTDSQTGGSWTGNEMAVIHRVAAVYDNHIVVQGDNLEETEDIQRCQITHTAVGILFT